ncbi:hypothetical protein ACEQ8H_000479 [Pleosporales sp. CAS-2024a]
MPDLRQVITDLSLDRDEVLPSDCQRSNLAWYSVGEVACQSQFQNSANSRRNAHNELCNYARRPNQSSSWSRDIKMLFTVVATASLLLGLSLAAPTANNTPTLLNKRDKFDKCSVFGSHCATQDQRFCDPDTGKISVCHAFGSDCWVRYTMDSCASASGKKREEVPAIPAHIIPAVPAVPATIIPPVPAVVLIKREPVEKRDLFNKCAAFGANCATNGKRFCQNGRQSICHQIGWGTDDCWIQYTAQTC